MILATPPFQEEERFLPFKETPSDTGFANRLIRSKKWLTECRRLLKPQGTLLIHSIPKWLPYYASFLDGYMEFKYWIALENPRITSENSDLPLIPAHEGILLYVKNSRKYLINKTRIPHRHCQLCGDFLADWGGKRKRMHPEGSVASDVWDDIQGGWSSHLPTEVLERLLWLVCKNKFNVLFLFFDTKISLEEVQE